MPKRPVTLKTRSATRTVSTARRAGMRRTKKDLHFRRRQSILARIQNYRYTTALDELYVGPVA